MDTQTVAPTNPVTNSIIQQHSAVLGFTEAAQIVFNKSPEAAYAERARGTFPVRVRLHGKRLVVFTSDLIEYLETGENQAEQSVALIRKTFKVKTGRPAKSESLEATRRGIITVTELRAQASIKLEGGA